MSEGNRQGAVTRCRAYSASRNGLGPLERYGLLEERTEHAFTDTVVKNKKEGVYACRLCGRRVARSSARCKEKVKCARCRSHLGHVSANTLRQEEAQRISVIPQ